MCSAARHNRRLSIPCAGLLLSTACASLRPLGASLARHRDPRGCERRPQRTRPLCPALRMPHCRRRRPQHGHRPRPPHSSIATHRSIQHISVDASDVPGAPPCAAGANPRTLDLNLCAPLEPDAFICMKSSVTPLRARHHPRHLLSRAHRGRRHWRRRRAPIWHRSSTQHSM